MEPFLLTLFLGGFFIMQLIWFMLDPRALYKRFFSLLSPRKGYWKVFFLLVVLLTLLQLAFPQLQSMPEQWPASFLDPIFIYLGILLYLMGISFATWARFTMKRKWLPSGEGHDGHIQDTLFTDGPFAYSRNPIYLGLIFMAFGSSLALRTYHILFTLIPFVMFYLSIIEEEVLLEKHFGKAYHDYKMRVGRFL